MSLKSELFTVETLVTVTIMNTLMIVFFGLVSFVAPVPTDAVALIFAIVLIQLIYIAAFVHIRLNATRHAQNTRARVWRDSMRTL